MKNEECAQKSNRENKRLEKQIRRQESRIEAIKQIV
jgi:hypothetical protein